MVRDNFNPLLKSVERCFTDAHESCKKYREVVDKLVVKFDNSVSYSDKLLKWAEARIIINSAISDITDVTKDWKAEWKKLEEICDSSVKTSPVLQSMDTLEEKYNSAKTLSDLRKVHTLLENKTKEIEEWKSLEKELMIKPDKVNEREAKNLLDVEKVDNVIHSATIVPVSSSRHQQIATSEHDNIIDNASVEHTTATHQGGTIISVEHSVCYPRGDFRSEPERNINNNARLAPLAVPKFDGRIESFTEFLSSYNDLVHNNPTISEGAKAVYFKNAIIGKAARCISGIPATANDYRRMYEKIVAKYSKVALNKHTILRKLETLSPALSNAQSLQDKIDEIEEILNQLDTAHIGIDDSTNPVWQRLILRKFPAEITRKIVTETHNDPTFTVRDLIETIEDEVFGIEFNEQAGIENEAPRSNNLARSTQMHHSQNRGGRYRSTENYGNQPTLSGPEEHRNHEDSSRILPNQRACLLCDSRIHSAAQCTLPHREKILAVRRRRLCWKCFNTNHNSFNCFLNNCVCGEAHHPSLCRRNEQDSHPSWNNGNYDRNIIPQRNGNSNNLGNRQRYEPDNRVNLRNENAQRVNGNFSRQPNQFLQQNQNYNVPANIHRTAENHAAILDPTNIEERNSREQGVEDINLQIGHTSIMQKATLPDNHQQPVLMTCEARIFDSLKQEFVNVNVFFDSGSQQTLINENIANALGIEAQEFTNVTISGVCDKAEQYKAAKMKLEMLDKAGNQVNFSAITKPFICKGFRSANLNELDLSYIKRNNFKIANSKICGEMQRPDILIGADNYTTLVLNEAAVILPSKLQLVNTVFGQCIFGKAEVTTNEQTSEYTPEITVNTTIIEYEREELTPNQMLKEMYELESLGIKHAGSPSIENTVRYFERYKQLISFENSIVTAPFPLKDDISLLSSNRKMAYVRLVSLVNNFSRNAEMKNWYIRKMNEYKEEGIIEEVAESNECLNSVGMFYIPHHGVWKPDKVEKPLRIVFDASASEKGCLSLNQAINTGEVFVKKIADIVLSARKSKYIITCDIEGAFTQIRLPTEHRDLCRFLWLVDPNKPATKENIRCFRFNRLPFGINASPSILNMAIVGFLETLDTELASEILKQLYVDNVMLSADNVDELRSKITESKEIFKPISFNMREYVTNVTEINRELPENDKGKFGETKMLGVSYNTEKDTLKAKISIKTESNLSRRTVVKQLHSVFDPIGLLAPSIISMRFAMREAFDSTQHWNDKLPADLKSEWCSLIERYNHAQVEIPRYLGSEHKIVENQILWIFTDASKQAVAACTYLQDEQTKKISCLLSGKAKMTPKIKVPLEDTIPKFELTSILLGIEIAQQVIESLELARCKIYIVNDSTSALSWVTHSKRLRKSCELIRDKIVNAVDTISANYMISTKFFHCATDLNTADIATRGVSPHELQTSDWVNGPKWLCKPLEALPLVPYVLEKIAQTSSEQNEECVHVNHANATENYEPVLKLGKFRSSREVQRSILCLIKLIKRKVQVIRSRKSSSTEMNKIWAQISDKSFSSPSDMALAEKAVILENQVNLDIQHLQKKFRQKEVFTDEYGIIRFKSRLQNAELDYDTRNPIYLPESSEYLKIVIKEYHEQSGHGGKEYVKMLIRQRFWIPRPTKLINRTIRKCPPCKISASLPFRAPNMPSLPIDRTKGNKAFENTGVDCLGPFSTKEEEKVYVCLFTCLVVRAVHLEILDNLSGSEFLKAFIRFTSRRGIPRLMRSDNGTNFVLAAKVIDVIYEKDEDEQSTMNFCESNGIQWIFNPPKAPFMGGVWERLVRTVKSAFYKTVGNRKLSKSDLHTTMVKIEAIVNSRPLTAVDNEYIIQPIRPCDFISPGANLLIPSFNSNFDDPNYEPELLSTVNDAKERLDKIEILLEKFWQRFKTEYLVSLRDQQKLKIKQGKCAKRKGPVLDEIVLIEDDLLPKHRWNYGKVVKLCQGKDGQVRSAVIDCNGNKLHRPIINLYSFEIPTIETSTVLPESEAPILKHNSNVDNACETKEMIKPLESKRTKRLRVPPPWFSDFISSGDDEFGDDSALQH